MNYLFVIPCGVSRAQNFNIFPIGIAYVSASLKQAGFSVFTINLEFHSKDVFSALKKVIISNQIDVICTGGLSFDCKKVLEVFEIAKQINPKIIAVAGGGLISSDPLPAMRVIDADFGIIGEGEITICELAHALENGLGYDEVPGLIFRKDNSYVLTKPRPEILDLDSVHFPDYDGLNYAEWTKISGCGLIVGSRSCTHNCTFCFHTSGRKYRQRSLDNIFSEIDYQINRFNIKSINMSDELFASSKPRVYEFCKRIRAYNITWGVALRVCDVDADLLKLMKASGCVGISYGLESADNSVLKSMKKQISVEQIEKALELTYDASINVTGGFIFGDINEDLKTVNNTLDFWRRNNKRHYMNVSMIIVFPGSFLYKHACNAGLIKDREQFLREGCKLINVSKLSDSEYKEVTSLITELRLHPHVPAESFKITDIKLNGECAIDFVCRKCRCKSKAKVPFWFGKEVHCPTCGMINFVDPFQEALHQQDAFMTRAPKDSTIAMWGAGGIYYKLINTYNTLSSENYILVDGSISKQGLKICHKIIHAPEIIKKNKIKSVIIMALSQKNEICDIVRSQYPFVENVYFPDIEKTGDGIVPVLTQL